MEKSGEKGTDLFSSTANQVQECWASLLVATGKYPPFSSKINPSPFCYLFASPLFARAFSKALYIPLMHENKFRPFF
jgi:hypothetical protein